MERELKIAYGKSSNAYKWKNDVTTWEELCGKLKRTTRTKETVAQYHAMTRSEKAAIKDKGGFVGGHLKNGRRKVQNVECRSFLSLDADEAEPGFIEKFEAGCEYAAAIYTTHGHVPEKPRVRIVIPFAEDISPEAYVAVARYYAALWGIDQFDECSYRVNQLMYWPTTPSDGEYICRIVDGPFMDAMKFLEDYPDWRDYSKLPTSSRETEVRRHDGKMQEDPLTKENIVGTFCRTYDIHDVIRKFLSDIYAPSATVEGRYDYIPGEGTAGLVVYDDKFAYSHHATDPACGKLLNAFDLVRTHKFGDADEMNSFNRMAAFAESDPLVKETLEKEKTEQAKKDFEEVNSKWEDPIPFDVPNLPGFPVDALPKELRDYDIALAENTQTPLDMAACASLNICSIAMQGKIDIQGKPDWIEQTNTYMLIVMESSERKSAVLNAEAKPLNDFESEQNKLKAGSIVECEMRRSILEKRKSAIEAAFTKGKATDDDVRQVADEIANFKEEKPLKLYVDDITTEKLTSVLAENNGISAILSTEGGIFDILAGSYSRSVNIDVLLKGYSGDPIRVDRIGRTSESIMRPALSVLLMVQPNVLSGLMKNDTFRGRGLTARFLYCIPRSRVGSRVYRTQPIPAEVRDAYERKILNLLQDETCGVREVIKLSPEADRMLEDFSNELEPKMKADYADVADWAGKLVGNTLRIAGILCRASVFRSHDFLDKPEPLVVSAETMSGAIKIGRYFLEHARAAYALMGADPVNRECQKVLKIIRGKGMKEFSKRDLMRVDKTLKTAEEAEPVIKRLMDYGYIVEKPVPARKTGGRPPAARYLVNPKVFE